MSNEFWRDNSVYPFVHAVLPAALYFATRKALLSLLLMYVWETVEALSALVVSQTVFGEGAADSLIGDPLVGALGIGALALLDVAYGWAAVVTATTALWLRLLAFAYVAVLSLGFFVLSADDVERMRALLVALYGIGIVLIALLMYSVALRTPGFRAPLAAWLALVGVLAIVAALPGPSSAYVRVVAVNGAAFVVALFLLAIETF